MPAPVADPPPAPGPLPAAALAAVTAPLQSIRPAARPARRPAARPPEAVWAVQLGAYKDRSFALKTLRQAVSLGVPALKGAKQAVTQTTVNGVRLYQARLLGLTQSRAEKACEGLRRLDAPCRLQQLGR
jgi:cell division septation protein DedD